MSSSVGVAGGYQLDSGATVPPLLLEEDEALAIALSLRTVASGTVSGADEAGLRAMVKLDRVLPGRLRRRVRAMHGAVVPMYMASPQNDATLLVRGAEPTGAERRARRPRTARVARRGPLWPPQVNADTLARREGDGGNR